MSLIEKLLGDRTTLVVGSAVMAFEEVCPERTELIHKQFRKLCHLLVDVEEWGQVKKSCTTFLYFKCLLKFNF